MSEADARLRQLNRDWDRINRAKYGSSVQPDTLSAPAEGAPVTPAQPSEGSEPHGGARGQND